MLMLQNAHETSAATDKNIKGNTSNSVEALKVKKKTRTNSTKHLGTRSRIQGRSTGTYLSLGVFDQLAEHLVAS